MRVVLISGLLKSPLIISHLSCGELGLEGGWDITVVTLIPPIPPIFFSVKNWLALACFLDYLKKINIKTI